jgi:hypothetical protein
MTWKRTISCVLVISGLFCSFIACMRQDSNPMLFSSWILRLEKTNCLIFLKILERVKIL